MVSQAEVSKANETSWQSHAYQAWLLQYGTPVAAAKKLLNKPGHKSRRILPYLPGELSGMQIANPLGSNGRLAVDLALLGANCTVFDICADSARYAKQLANAAGVTIEYIVGDFLKTGHQKRGLFDAVVLELGILHYFVSLEQFCQVSNSLLKPGGVLIINDFHPLLKKALSVAGEDVELTGNYFASELEQVDVAYQHLFDEPLPKCQVKRWTLGETVTAVSQCGLRIVALEELPGWDTDVLPQMFTLVAIKDKPNPV